MTEKLIAAISEALRARPNERLGQMLKNTAVFNGRILGLWDIHDEDWIELLTKDEEI